MSCVPFNFVANRDDCLRCPECDYDLFGLKELRCPECGTPFDPAELSRREARRHPYLFEDHLGDWPARFIKTYCRTHRRAKFWLSVIRGRRILVPRTIVFLVLSEVICALGPILLLVAIGLFKGWQVSQTTPTHGPIAAKFRLYLPSVIDIAPLTFFPLLWPILSFAIMAGFRASLKRFRISWRELLQCIAYNFPPFVTGWWIFLGITYFYPWFCELFIGIVAVLSLWCYLIVTSFRLYLRFENSWPLVGSAHLIEALLIYELILLPLL
jgi:hypothetical protein